MPTKNVTPPALLREPMTTMEVCAALGISRSTLQRLKSLDAGPPYFELGGREWYERADVFAYLQNLRIHPAVNYAEIVPTVTRATPRRAPNFRRKPTTENPAPVRRGRKAAPQPN